MKTNSIWKLLYRSIFKHFNLNKSSFFASANGRTSSNLLLLSNLLCSENGRRIVLFLLLVLRYSQKYRWNVGLDLGITVCSKWVSDWREITTQLERTNGERCVCTVKRKAGKGGGEGGVNYYWQSVCHSNLWVLLIRLIRRFQSNGEKRGTSEYIATNKHTTFSSRVLSFLRSKGMETDWLLFCPTIKHK